jgi:putative methyltransferase (TIGR04325 family)
MKLRTLIKLIIPPVLIVLAKKLREKLPGYVKEWEYIPGGWVSATANPRIKGWDEASVLEIYKAKWPAFLQELKKIRPFGASPESPTSRQIDLSFHNSIMIYAYSIAMAARYKTNLSMLDWGGGIGHYYLISQALVSNLDIDYHCKDMPIFARHGRSLFPQAHFYEDETCFEHVYDFVFAGSSLQYSPDWARVLTSLAQVTHGYLLVSRLPIVYHADSYVFFQRPYRYGYNTEYIAWCLNRTNFLQAAEAAGLVLVREFINGDQSFIPDAPEPCQYHAFLFQRGASPDESQANLSTRPG